MSRSQADLAALSKLSLALQQELNGVTDLVWADSLNQTIRTIVQTKGPVSSLLVTAIGLLGGSVVRQFSSINRVLAEVPASGLLTLAARPDVERMTADHLVQQSASHLEEATNADSVRSYNALFRTFSGLDGTGVGIAVLDSGLMADHSSFDNSLGLSRVVASKDIVSSNTRLAHVEALLGLTAPIPGGNKDGYGHGSHVSGAAAGRSAGSGNSLGFMGVAPNAHLIDVRVLDGRGLGQVSDVIAGIDWALANRLLFNIRVMNLSLGAASTESYVTDPICRAVRKAVASGVTVVVAAGNYGLTADGLERYGSITAPGNDPTVITVGSANTQQTDSRADETINHFSSRGPTRSYSMDSSVKRHDNLLKPDLVAPGNRIVAGESNGAWLVGEYPQLHTTGSGANAFMQLSGSSVASGVVAGAVALLLQKNPGLTPPLVKAVLQYTAQQLPDANISQQGAGLLNVEGSSFDARISLQPITG